VELRSFLLSLPINAQYDQMNTGGPVLKDPPKITLLLGNIHVNIIQDILRYFPIIHAGGHLDDLGCFLLPLRREKPSW
jgi:hypothetical protein